MNLSSGKSKNRKTVNQGSSAFWFPPPELKFGVSSVQAACKLLNFFKMAASETQFFGTRGNDFCFFVSFYVQLWIAAIKTVRILKHTSSIIVRTITATLFFNVHKCGVLLIPLCPRCFVLQKLKQETILQRVQTQKPLESLIQMAMPIVSKPNLRSWLLRTRPAID